jgi:protein SCO1
VSFSSQGFARAERRRVALAAMVQCLLWLTASFAPLAGAASPATQRAIWPADSLFHVDPPLETAAGRSTSFAATGGRVQIVTMFYASCPMACPLTIETLKNVEAQLPVAERAELGILMVSVDPERDTPAALNALATKRRVTDSRWTLARASVADTRKLAAVLGIQYRAMGTGDFDHSSTLVLLDRHGRVLARSNKLGVPDPAFITTVRKALDIQPPRTAIEKES